MEPDITLFLAEKDGIMGLLLSRYRFVVHQAYRDAIRNMESLLKIPLIKKFDRFLQVGIIDTFSCPSTFLVLTSRVGRSNILYC